MAPPRFAIVYSAEAQTDLRGVKSFRRPAIVKAIDELAYQADVETEQRIPLAEPLDELPDATWEVRVGEYRALYCMPAPEPEEGQTVVILRVIFKGTATTKHAVSRARKR